MSNQKLETVSRYCPWLIYTALAVPVVYSVGALVVVFTIRLRYPYEIEWMDGAMIDLMQRILDGHLLHGEPSLESIPSVYNPVYFYLSALLMRVFGVGFFHPRLISILAAIGLLALLAFAVKSLTKSWPAGILAVGLYAAAFHFTGSWMDVGRPDSLFLFILMLAFVSGSSNHASSENRWLIVSGLLYGLAYFTKQNTLVVMAAMTVAALPRIRTHWVQIAAIWLPAIAVFMLLDGISGGWYSFYTFDNVLTFKTTDEVAFWPEMITALWPLLILALGYIIYVLFESYSAVSDDVECIDVAESSWWRQTISSAWRWFGAPIGYTHLQYIAFGSSLVVSSWRVAHQRWAFTNLYMPAAFGVVLLASLSVGLLLRWLCTTDLDNDADRVRLKMIVAVLLAIVLVYQFVLLRYDVPAQLPSDADRKAGDSFVDRLAALPGDVWLFDTGYLGSTVGKSTYFQRTQYLDAGGYESYEARDEDGRWRRQYVREIYHDAVQNQVVPWIVSYSVHESWTPYYLYYDSFFSDPDVFYPVTGAHFRPESLMIRNPVAYGGGLPFVDPLYDFMFIDGWSGPEEWGRWAEAEEVSIVLSIETGYDYSILLELFPYCGEENLEQSMSVMWNGHYVGEMHFDSCDPQVFHGFVDSSWIDEFNSLTLRFDYALSPADLGLSGDTRSLAAGLLRTEVMQTSPAD